MDLTILRKLSKLMVDHDFTKIPGFQSGKTMKPQSLNGKDIFSMVTLDFLLDHLLEGSRDLRCHRRSTKIGFRLSEPKCCGSRLQMFGVSLDCKVGARDAGARWAKLYFSVCKHGEFDESRSCQDMMQWHMRQRDPGGSGKLHFDNFHGGSNSHHIWRLDRYIAGLLEAILLERRDVRKR